MFDIRNFEETLQTEYAETNDTHKVIRLAVQYIHNEISCGNLVEESKFKMLLDKTECNNVTKLLNYIGHLKDVQADYEKLKKKVKELSNLVDGLY